MRFSLIDQVLERHADRLVAVKAVSTAEEYLGDHFPGFPVLPGVLMLEALVQAGRELVRERAGGRRLVLAQVRNVRYGNMVRPGQKLIVEVSLREKAGAASSPPASAEPQGTADASELRFELTGVGKVDDAAGGAVAVQGRFVLAPLPGSPEVSIT